MNIRNTIESSFCVLGTMKGQNHRFWDKTKNIDYLEFSLRLVSKL